VYTGKTYQEEKMRKIFVIGMLLLVAAMAFAGGSSEESGSKDAEEKSSGYAWIMDKSDDDMLPGVNPLEVKGDIIAMGSSTVFPLSEVMAARFQDEGYSGSITIDSIGSGAGFERFCVAGESDISNASRPIKDSEIEAAKKIGYPVIIRAAYALGGLGSGFCQNIEELESLASRAFSYSGESCL